MASISVSKWRKRRRPLYRNVARNIRRGGGGVSMASEEGGNIGGAWRQT